VTRSVRPLVKGAFRRATLVKRKSWTTNVGPGLPRPWSLYIFRPPPRWPRLECWFLLPGQALCRLPESTIRVTAHQAPQPRWWRAAALTVTASCLYELCCEHSILGYNGRKAHKTR